MKSQKQIGHKTANRLYGGLALRLFLGVSGWENYFLKMKIVSTKTTLSFGKT